jgi:hypothetical protein
MSECGSPDYYGHFDNASSKDTNSDKDFRSLSPIRGFRLPSEMQTSSISTDGDGVGLEDSMNASFSSEFSEFEMFQTDLEYKPFKNRVNRLISVTLAIIFAVALAYVDYRTDFRIQKFIETLR